MLPTLATFALLMGSATAGSSISELPQRILPDAPAEPVDDAPTSNVPRRKLHQIAVEGEGIGSNRSAYVWVPEGDGPFPVVFAVHGGKHGSGRDMAGRFQLAHDRDILMVYPNGGDVPKGTGWVGPDKHDGTTADRDLRYFRALIDTLTEQLPVQQDRMFVTGMSGGGYMTDLLWCEMSDTFAGFGVVSRAMPRIMAQTCNVARPRPYLLILGTADDGIVNEHQLPLDETRAFIRTKLGCSMPPVFERTLPDKGDRFDIVHTRYACGDGAVFDDYVIVGGGHSWPGVGKPKPSRAQDLHATEVILEHFGL